MNPHAVFSATLVTSLVLWLPSMRATLRGDLDLAPSGLRYVAALVVARLAWNGLARLVNAYRSTPPPVSEAERAPAAGPARNQDDASPAPPQRRRDDPRRGGGAGNASVAA